MIFLNSFFLWGLLAVTIPIIIHFFNFQRPKKVFFTNVEFLSQVQQSARSRNKVKNIVVLLMRMLFLACLALAFAQPIIPNKEAKNQSTGQKISIYIDNSHSAQNEKNNKRILDLASGYVYEILKSFSAKSLFQLTDNSFSGSMAYFGNSSKITDRLSNLPFSPSGRKLGDVYQKQLDILQSNGATTGNQLFIISDFQKSTVGDVASIPFDSTQFHYLIPITPDQVANVFVDSIWLENPFVRINEANILHLKLKNAGKEKAENKAIKLLIENTQVAAHSVSIEPMSSAEIDMSFVVTQSGIQAAKIEIEDYPVIFDNEYFFTLRVAPKIRILSISDENAQFSSAVFSNEPFFEVSTGRTDGLDYSKIPQSDLVVLEGVKTIDAALQQALRSYSKAGGNIAVFPAENADLASYTATLGISMKSMKDQEKVALDIPDKNNPFYEGVFEKIVTNMNVPDVRKTIEWAGGKKILQLRNQQAFMSAFTNEKSTIYLFASPLQDAYSNFAKHALYVPTMYKMAVSSKMQSEKLAWSLQEATIMLKPDSIRQNDIFKLIPSKRGIELIPSQRITGNQLIIETPKENFEAGHYTLVRSQDNKPVGILALNYDKSESEMEWYTAEELEKFLGNKKHIQILKNIEQEKFAQEFREKNVAKPLWRYFLVLSLLALLVEVVFIRFGHHWKSNNQ